MKAIQVHEFGSPPRMSCDDLPEPQPGPGQVVVKVEAAGVNPVDVYVAGGQYAFLQGCPYTPGGDAAGTVLRVGEGVEGLQEGDRVLVIATAAGRLQGAFAEQCLCDVDPDRTGGCPQAWPLPQNLSFAQGAAINVPYVTAFRALFDAARARAGESLLIHGATGGVGIAALQIAKAHGLEVWATGGSEKGRDLLWKLGADFVLDHTRDDYLEEISPEGIEIILEMLANVNLARDMEHLARRGRIVVIGNRGSIEINPRLLMASEGTITGINYWGGGPAGVRRALEAIEQGISAGDVRPVIQAEMPLEEAGRALELVMQGGSRGKIVLLP